MLFRSTRRAFAPQNLLTTALSGLVVAGVAAAAIGSAQIANNSISGLDLKNNSVGSADIANNSLSTADVKNRSLTGTDVKNNALTGAQVNEGSLAKVPSAAASDTATSATNATNATNANNAANADKLGGLAPAAFVSSDKVKFVSAKLAPGETKALATFGAVSLYAKCSQGGGSDTVEVFASTTTDGAYLEGNGDSVINTTTPEVDREVLSDSNTTGVASFSNDIDQAFIVGPDGSYLGIDGETTALGTSVLGATCVVAGYTTAGTIA